MTYTIYIWKDYHWVEAYNKIESFIKAATIIKDAGHLRGYYRIERVPAENDSVFFRMGQVTSIEEKYRLMNAGNDVRKHSEEKTASN